MADIFDDDGNLLPKYNPNNDDNEDFNLEDFEGDLQEFLEEHGFEPEDLTVINVDDPFALMLGDGMASIEAAQTSLNLATARVMGLMALIDKEDLPPYLQKYFGTIWEEYKEFREQAQNGLSRIPELFENIHILMSLYNHGKRNDNK